MNMWRGFDETMIGNLRCLLCNTYHIVYITHGVSGQFQWLCWKLSLKFKYVLNHGQRHSGLLLLPLSLTRFIQKRLGALGLVVHY